MRNFNRLVLASASLLALLARGAAAETFTSTDTPKSIVDLATTTSVITPSVALGIYTIADVNISITLQHTWAEDIELYLSHGSVVNSVLLTDVRSSNDWNGTYVLDDAAAVNIDAAPTPGGVVSPGTYKTQSGSGLLAFNGLDPSGNWTLQVIDDEYLIAGTLNSWSLIITYAAIDQASLAPTIGSIISGDVSSLVGSFADRANARYAGGVEPAADVANPYLPGGTGGLWLRLGGSMAEGSGELENPFIATDASYDKDQWFAQGGLSHVLYDGGDKKWVGSLFGQYSTSSASVSDTFGPVGSVDNEGFGVGYSSTWLFASGLYIDSLSLAQWQDVEVATAGGDTGSTDALTLASSVEAGLKFDLGNGMALTPQVQAIYQRQDIDSFTDTGGTTYAFDDNNSLVGRAGVSLGYAGTSSDGTHNTQAGITASVLEQFLDGGDTVVNGTSLGYGGFDTTSWMVAGNLSYTPVSTGFGLGLNVSYRDSFKSEGEQAIAGDVSLSWRW